VAEVPEGVREGLVVAVVLLLKDGWSGSDVRIFVDRIIDAYSKEFQLG
jgi:hypothetical protein